ncbi:MAG: hypothetical protein U0798_14385 [Gemmataceae bacterium]
MVVDAEPRWDFKLCSGPCPRSPRRCLLLPGQCRLGRHAGRPAVYPRIPGTRQELFAYDLIVIGDLPSTSLAPDQREYIREFVAEGGGLIHIAGRLNAPSWFVNTPLADVLPVDHAAKVYGR